MPFMSFPTFGNRRTTSSLLFGSLARLI
ncbi:unnamed protein product [Arabidopsis thaliana]|uniref:Uncharacterized protein n=2 Tax=Arabidopsis thaliana TaxID=3702 RepID=A0A654G607_ARATH|nr:uncharacterized protein AT5G38397 [Arabidopsis thaliana]ANM70756.1 hypothetical protein AT5G38397 [Arabidopsis thaliana]CAA0406114.1 unnamed protein product [Arabidopsis thaliana]VYS68608.1 unnamed protein product [Arabidopsis thaliana]|eukprot:NP_001332341.1 hypothetical protein AT5G38397 [Arabidopsis thaliana]